MRRSAFVYATMESSSCHEPTPMSFNPYDLPEGWMMDDLNNQDLIYGDPPALYGPSRISFFGLLDNDPAYKIYSVPVDTPVARIIQVFQVGSHGAMSYGFDADTVVALVMENVNKIEHLCPCQVIFVDAAGLKLKFKHQVTEKEVLEIEALFQKQNAIKAGLEQYVSELKEGEALFAPVLRDNLIHLWWD